MYLAQILFSNIMEKDEYYNQLAPQMNQILRKGGES